MTPNTDYHGLSTTVRTWLRRFSLPIFAVALLTQLAHAQSGTGTISGRVFNPATSEYVRNAEVRIAGTSLSVLTEDSGYYRVANVPAGDVTITIHYTGYDIATAAATVTAGSEVTRDFNLVRTPETAQKGDEIITLSAFTVTTEREGNSKAIMEQKGAMNVKTVVATDSFGDIAEGNIGEFLKFMPGITLDYVETDTRAARMGGLEARYGAVTLDGNSMANTSTGGFGGDSRQFEFEAVSINNIETIEVNKTLTAKLPADAPAGTINLRTKSALDRKGSQFNFTAGLIANQYEHSLSKTPRHDDEAHAKARPTFVFDYSNAFFGRKLGVAVNGSSSTVFKEQFRHGLSYDYTSSQAVAAGTPLLTAINFKDGPKITDKYSGGLKLDYDALPGLRLSLSSSYTYFSDEIANRNLNFRVSSSQLGAGSSMTKVIAGPTTSNGTRIEQTGSTGNKKTDTTNGALSFRYRKSNLTIEGQSSYSRARQQNGSEHMGTVDVANTQLTGITYIAERPSVSSSNWNFTQTGGADWYDLSNYGRNIVQTSNVTVGRSRAKTQQWVQQISARVALPFRVQTNVEAGLYDQLMVRDREQISSDIMTWVGPTGNQLTSPFPASMASFWISKPWGGNIYALPVPDKGAVRSMYNSNPSYFTRSPSQIGDAIENVLESNQDIKEHIKAGYLMGDTRLGKFMFQAGVRYELTDTENTVQERIPDRLNPFSVASPTASDPGRRVAPSSSSATYPDFIRARYAGPRTSTSGEYDRFLPSGSVKYQFTPNLQMKVGYHKAIKRPRLDRIAGPWSIDETNLEVTIPNPNLTPEHSQKYSATLEYYFEPSGTVSVTAFETTIEGSSEESAPAPASAFGFGDHPVYGSYDFVTWLTIPGTRTIRGLELNYSQQLTFLRYKLLRGTRIFATYSRFTSNPRPGNFVPTNATGGVSWRYGKFNASIAGTWTDDILTGSNTVSSSSRYFTGDREWLKQRYIFDVGFGYRFTRNLEAFVSGRNAFNSGKTWFFKESDGRTRQFEKYGGQWTIGIKGRY